MNILVVGDEIYKGLYDYFEPSKLEGVDLILSIGDLPPQYLSFLATFTKAPVLYVHGNHDQDYDQTPPDGCICIDNKIYEHEGVRILGLPGCMKYNKNSKYQFTDYQMDMKVMGMLPSIHLHHGFDILLTHSPALGLGDDTDLPHHGFKAFRHLLDTWHPKYMVYGHVHLNYGSGSRVMQYKDSTLINGFQKYCFEYESGKQIYM